MSTSLLPPSRPASQSSIRETTTCSRSTSPSGPLPLPLHPINAQAQAQRENDENADPFTSKPPSSSSSLPFDKAHNSGSTGIPRKPRLSVTGANPAAKDIIHRGVGAGAGGQHMKRLSTGSLRGEQADAGARVENLEVRVRNYKMDCIGLAKDILGLCEENAASKAWIREIAVALDSMCKESKDSRMRTDELVDVYERVKAQVDELRAVKAENEAVKNTLEWQSLILKDLLEDKKRREQHERARAEREEQLEGQMRTLLGRDQERRAEIERLSALIEQRTSSATPGDTSDVGTAVPGDMMQALLMRIAELERSFADTTMRAESAPLISPTLTFAEAEKRPKKASADLSEDDRRERELARQLEKGRREAKEKEARMQALLGEALERNLVLAARVRELETHKTSSSAVHAASATAAADEATTAFGLAPAAGSRIADTLFPAQTPAAARGRHSASHAQEEAQTPAPTLPELDPMSPFVLDRTVKRGERRALGIAKGRSSNLRE